MDLQLVVEVRHFKISQTIWSESISRRVIVYLEGLYNKNKLVRSAEYKLHDGVVLAIPWSNKLDEFRLHVHYIDDRLKQSLGSCLYQLPTDARFHTNEYDENKLILDLFPDGGKERIGRFLCHVTLQRLYGDDQVRPHPKETQEDYFNRPIPGFKFRRLSKAINWHRLRGIDIEKVVERNDIKTLLTCLDDVTVGDAAEEGQLLPRLLLHCLIANIVFSLQLVYRCGPTFITRFAIISI